MSDRLIARIQLVKSAVSAAERAEIIATKTVRRIRGLEMTPTFDQHLQEVPAPPGWKRTQSGLLVRDRGES